MAFPLNFPLWSLFFELLANLGYAIDRRRFGNRALIFLAAASGVLLIGTVLVAGQIHSFGVGGKLFLLTGALRIAFPFTVGVLICRTGIWRRLPSLPGWLLAAVLAAVLIAPIAASAYDAVMATVVLPVLAAFGARVAVKPDHMFWTGIGRLSYPVYLIHAPVIEAGKLAGLPWSATVIVALALSVAALLTIDEPIRAELQRRRGLAST